MRTFIAIELSKDLQDKLNHLQAKLKSDSLDVKWVKPHNIHLTLKFLGEIQENKIEAVKNILNNLAAKFKSFSLEISNLGAFPNLKSPRVIWIRVKAQEGDADIILEIVKILEEKLEKIDFPKEKRAYQPHITIGRIRSFKNIDALRSSLKNNVDFVAGSLRVKQICLIQSTLTPSGPIYNTIYAVKLS